MSEPTKVSLSLFVGLLSCAVAACSGIGQDSLVTVGIRPIDKDGALARDAGGPRVLGSDVMNQDPANSLTPREVAVDASAAMSATAGSGTPTENRRVATAFPVASIAGAGGLASGAAGAASPSDSLAESYDECGVIPRQAAGNVTSAWVNGSGLIEYDVKAPNVFVGVRTTLAVPAKPEPNGQMVFWPGIQPAPNGANFQPITNGAFMSVLAWGPLCPSDAPPGYSTWWFAPMYSNITASDSQYRGCHSGKVATAEPRHLLDIGMHLEGTDWVQKIVNRDTAAASDYVLDLKGQEQGRAIFAIDLQTNNKPTEDIIFTHTVLSMAEPGPDACEPMMRGMNDFASKPRVSADGKHCCIDRIVLRASRVMATTTDPP